ncbi:cell envelope integrity protein CreD [Lentisphaera profundi]|uniref:Cell envelope integrity protein CreD n=1 Tax=Lentisphaera profundi TaxID=1658616 RepID=A0ABY7VZN7_9BACT|nr:cell envelope integrity protein CreD [Lentisphaera profundi]WDE98665.1 cell envelope integrity protein CreD [Lentisphaera profundi]
MSDESPLNFKQRDFLKQLKNSLMAKIAMIAIIIALLYIPKSLILDLIHERENRSAEVLKEIQHKWGGPQNIYGAILSIPLASDKETFIHLHPEKLDILGQIHPEERKKSIFKTIVYKSDLDYQLAFNFTSITQLYGKEKLLWDQAILSFGISDLKGLSRQINLKHCEQNINARPGIPIDNGLKTGFHFPLNLDANEQQITLSTQLQINGSQELSFVPSGRQSIIQVQSTWPHPGFEGKYLPTSYNISDTGFDSHWEIHDLQRDFISSWRDREHALEQETCSVRLIQFNGSYSQVHRLVKYTLLFLCFTFAAIFICERLSGQIIHPLQYILFGFASLMFYVLLLSISEHLSFALAYLIASVICSIMMALYSRSLLANWKNSLSIGFTTGGLYGYLYGTIQLEDYALLMGSLGLIITLATVMYFTRDLSRYNTKEIKA